MTRQKMPFEPLNPPEVKLYTCGPTVYNYAHIGNLRTYIFEDLLRRVLEWNGYVVKHVMNITDVGHLTSDADEGEDKMLKGAEREKKTVWEIAEFYTQAFFEDLAKLNIEMPTIKPKATDHIPEMINQIKQLEENGLTYIANGNVYFDTNKIDDYGKLAQLDKQDLQAGARIKVDKNKKNPNDFVLWFTKSKFLRNSIIHPLIENIEFDDKKNQEMQWESPWGKGYPGWHIECSAMSIKYLGKQIDIHCGGIDHIPVHHTNEIAQAEGATGKKPWVRYWMHGNFLVLEPLLNVFVKNCTFVCPNCGFGNLINSRKDFLGKKESDGTLLQIKCQNKKCGKIFSGGIKMAKSGEFLTLNRLIEKGYNPLDYRYFCLQSHYRKQLTFSWEGMDAAKNGLKKLYAKCAECLLPTENDIDLNGYLELVKTQQPELNNYQDLFEKAINDDLNMPQALSILWDLLNSIASQMLKSALIKKFDTVLGLQIVENAEKIKNGIANPLPEKIAKLVADRDKARKEKNWKKSDELRAKIEKEGFIVKDGPKGTEVQPK